MTAAAVAPLGHDNAQAGEHSSKKTCPLPLDEPVCLRRLGLNFDPPSLVLEYERLNDGKLFHRRIGLRRLGPGADATRTAEKIRKQNEALLAEDQVPFEQLVSVVARLFDSKRGSEKGRSAKAVDEHRMEEEGPKSPATATTTPTDPGTPAGPVVDGNLDLNKLSTEELDKHKRAMDVDFLKNQKKPGDPGFVYDVRIEHVVGDDAEECGWDDSDQD